MARHAIVDYDELADLINWNFIARLRSEKQSETVLDELAKRNQLQYEPDTATHDKINKEIATLAHDLQNDIDARIDHVIDLLDDQALIRVRGR